MTSGASERYKLRHRVIQKLCWNVLGIKALKWFGGLELRINVVARNYSLIGETNGEKWLISLLPTQPKVFDVGFYDGSYTEEVLLQRPEARVVCFDPSRFGRRIFDAKYGSEPRVVFVDVALSNAKGEAVFYDYENMCNSLSPRREGLLNEAEKYTVKVMTVDEVCKLRGETHLDLMKVDAEGYDLHVLEGAEDMLQRQAIDIVMFEFASGWAASRRYLWEANEYIGRLPYKLFRLFNGFLLPFAYEIRVDSCCTLSAMYVCVSEKRLARGDIPIKHYRI